MGQSLEGRFGFVKSPAHRQHKCIGAVSTHLPSRAAGCCLVFQYLMLNKIKNARRFMARESTALCDVKGTACSRKSSIGSGSIAKAQVIKGCGALVVGALEVCKPHSKLRHAAFLSRKKRRNPSLGRATLGIQARP